jgi:hypothetical protein
MHPADELKLRTQKFAEAILRFCREATDAEVPGRIRDRLIGCGTGLGANYRGRERMKRSARAQQVRSGPHSSRGQS